MIQLNFIIFFNMILINWQNQKKRSLLTLNLNVFKNNNLKLDFLPVQLFYI